MSSGDDYCDANATNKSRNQSGIYGFAQLRTPDLGQIGQSDAHDQGSFHPFAERNDKSLKHLAGASHFENDFQFQFQG
jgi:hypothetical protein